MSGILNQTVQSVGQTAGQVTGQPVGQTPYQNQIPDGYQSPYANYGFDSGLQSYLDNQYIGSATDAGTAFKYDPTTQSFTGSTMGGRYNAIPLSVMQQTASGTGPGLASYYQSNFPTPSTPYFQSRSPQPVSIQPFNPYNRPGQPTPFPGFGGNITAGNPRRDGFNERPPVVQPGPNVGPQPRPEQKGLGGLQQNKWASRLPQGQ
jgi:hypothetical protein